ncbi:hypothetical protein VTN31DRAFT_6856 [Thermomyces dupontii]|uniref:uncharacterized protein n=1 Tax=Talaromyces thermophilus TaxID=28565 RepID=UPI0037426DA1
MKGKKQCRAGSQRDPDAASMKEHHHNLLTRRKEAWNSGTRSSSEAFPQGPDKSALRYAPDSTKPRARYLPNFAPARSAWQASCTRPGFLAFTWGSVNTANKGKRHSGTCSFIAPGSKGVDRKPLRHNGQLDFTWLLTEGSRRRHGGGSGET